MRSSKPRSRSKSNRSRSVGNVVNRVFDSSGPEGKVRGTPQQIIDKYNQLARDAGLANDRVAAENFQQHAEHYLRLLSEAQREQDARREQQERENRERQAQRDRERAERQERESGGKGGAAEEAAAPAETPEGGAPEGDSTLVETPEEAPKPKPRARKPRSRKSDGAKGDAAKGEAGKGETDKGGKPGGGQARETGAVGVGCGSGGEGDE